MTELFSQLLGYLKDLGLWLLEKLVDGLVVLGNLLIEAVAAVFSLLVAMLPNSFGFDLSNVSLPPSLSSVLGWVNWFFPVDTMVICLAAYLTVLLAWFAIRPVLRFIQVW